MTTNSEKIMDLFQQFVAKEDERSRIPLGGEIQACLDFCEYSIRAEYDKNSKTKYKSKVRKGVVSDDFIRAFGEFTREDKIRYYNKNVAYLVRIHMGNQKPPIFKQERLEGVCFMRSYKIKRWKKKNLRLDLLKQVLYAEREKTIKEYGLGDYIFRVSKNTDYYSFVLEAINSNVHEKAKTAHFGFNTLEDLRVWSEAVQLCIDYKHWERIYIELTKRPPPRMTSERIRTLSSSFAQGRKKTDLNQKEEKKEVEVEVSEEIIKTESTGKSEKKQLVSYSGQQSYESEESHENQGLDQSLSRTIVEDLVDKESENSQMQEIQFRNSVQVSEPKKNLDLFHKLFPEHELSELELEENYEMIFNDQKVRAMQNMIERTKFKIVVDFQKTIPCEAIFNAICSPELFQEHNKNITELSVKTLISSQNSAIMYMSHKAYNRLYRCRDFIFIRHGFSNGKNQFFIADKEMEHENFPPFMTIVRGKYSAIWGIFNKGNSIKLVAEIQVNNQGYLNEAQNTNLVLAFLKQFSNLKEYVNDNIAKLLKFKIFDINWDISKNQQNLKANEVRLFKKSSRQKNKEQQLMPKESPKKKEVEVKMMKKEKKVEKAEKVEKGQTKAVKQEKPASQTNIESIEIEKKKMEEEGEINPADLQKMLISQQIKLDFDQDGFVIVSDKFRKARYQLSPINVKEKAVLVSSDPSKHPIWKGNWKVDQKVGALTSINYKLIEDQKGVLKFILSKVGKNILSGKSVLNISLPVDIFIDLSNLELFTRSFGYAPVVLEPTVKKNPLERLKSVLAFGISMSALYLEMAKPFNPILGQTFQAWINGCPSYAEQISHHPPISALYFVGRGFRISAQLEAKVQMHVNSGDGTNEGIFKVTYDDGLEICFCSPAGEISGLVYGDRKFNLIGKAYCWIESECIFVQIVMNPSKKGFFSVGKQENPIDYFEGVAYQVKPQFMASVIKKRKAPSDSDCVKKLGIFSGIWHQEIRFNEDVILNIDKQYPMKMEYEKNPLPSDANWREDIAYRRIMQIQRAQTEKERLEVVQRGDRKLREKHNKKKH